MLYGDHSLATPGAVPVTAQTPFFLIFNLTSPLDGNSSEHFFLLEVITQVMFCPAFVPCSEAASNFKVRPLLTGPEAGAEYSAVWVCRPTVNVFVADAVAHVELAM